MHPVQETAWGRSTQTTKISPSHVAWEPIPAVVFVLDSHVNWVYIYVYGKVMGSENKRPGRTRSGHGYGKTGRTQPPRNILRCSMPQGLCHTQTSTPRGDLKHVHTTETVET